MRPTYQNIIFNTCAYIFFLLLTGSSCTKLVAVDPPVTSTNGENVFDDNETAIAALTGVYAKISATPAEDAYGLLTSVFFATGLTGDELQLRDEANEFFAQFYFNNIQPFPWKEYYKIIYLANAGLEQLPQATNVTPQVKKQMMGEARFVRALAYFYLVNLFSDVPMPVGTDYLINNQLPRSSENDVYNLIITDLKEAQELLSDHYVSKDGISSTTERVRPNKWAATALLARAYLYRKDYINAEIEADKIISHTELFKLVELDQAFLMNNEEAIWQIQPVSRDIFSNTREGMLLKILPENTEPIVFLHPDLVNSFNPKDLRLANWINTVVTNSGQEFTYAYKYKIGIEDEPVKEYSTVFRLAEQYLIRAEARIHLGKVIEGIADINEIRSRATDKTLPAVDQLPQLSASVETNEAITAIEQERRWELFTEWGHRWFDLKRTGRIDGVLKIIKPSWENTDKLFPIPEVNEKQGRPQNDGY
jgi:starch-binding outer membrane protein, SusD/RagB family